MIKATCFSEKHSLPWQWVGVSKVAYKTKKQKRNIKLDHHVNEMFKKSSLLTAPTQMEQTDAATTETMNHNSYSTSHIFKYFIVFSTVRNCIS
jgi:hypothetical protein